MSYYIRFKHKPIYGVGTFFLKDGLWCERFALGLNSEYNRTLGLDQKRDIRSFLDPNKALLNLKDKTRTYSELLLINEVLRGNEVFIIEDD